MYLYYYLYNIEYGVPIIISKGVERPKFPSHMLMRRMNANKRGIINWFFSTEQI